MHWEFVFAGYGVVLGGIILYATLLITRGRKVGAKLPPERRQFLD